MVCEMNVEICCLIYNDRYSPYHHDQDYLSTLPLLQPQHISTSHHLKLYSSFLSTSPPPIPPPSSPSLFFPGSPIKAIPYTRSSTTSSHLTTSSSGETLSYTTLSLPTGQQTLEECHNSRRRYMSPEGLEIRAISDVH